MCDSLCYAPFIYFSVYIRVMLALRSVTVLLNFCWLIDWLIMLCRTGRVRWRFTRSWSTSSLRQSTAFPPSTRKKTKHSRRRRGRRGCVAATRATTSPTCPPPRRPFQTVHPSLRRTRRRCLHRRPHLTVPTTWIRDRRKTWSASRRRR